MEKMYQVYSVDTCFAQYAMDYILVGAEDEDDLIDHLEEFIEYKPNIKSIIKEREWRIKKIDHLYTDTPYKGLDSFGYYE